MKIPGFTSNARIGYLESVSILIIYGINNKIENIELDGINDFDLFGIKFKGKCKIGSISVKHSGSFSPY